MIPFWIYDLPELAAAVLIVLGTLAVVVLGHWLARRVFPVDVPEDRRGLAMTMLGLVATINGLLVAFSAVSVWESLSGADAAVANEANTVGELARDLAVFDTAESQAARKLLGVYVQDVITTEWPAMARGESVEQAWKELDATFRAIAKLDPDTPRHVALMPEIWSRANEMVKHRRTRVFASQAEVPSMLWAVILLGSFISFALMYVLPFDRFHVVMVGSYAASMGLVFFFIVIMDKPFAGQEAITPAAMQAALDGMQRWDREVEEGSAH